MSSWRADAACRGMDPALFHPDPEDRGLIARAKAICAACPVRERCAAEHSCELYGIWAGLTAEERGVKRVAVCKWCGMEFAQQHLEGCCSREHKALHDRAYMRDYQRRHRLSGKMHADGHGTLAKYRSGCHCPSCRWASREHRRRFRGAA